MIEKKKFSKPIRKSNCSRKSSGRDVRGRRFIKNGTPIPFTYVVFTNAIHRITRRANYESGVSFSLINEKKLKKKRSCFEFLNLQLCPLTDCNIPVRDDGVSAS